MITERTPDGLEIRLREHGFTRYFGAAFLFVWLCGWGAGEFFAIYFLVKGALAVITQTPVFRNQPPPSLEGVLIGGAFLLVWLTVWTIGGIAAIHEFLRLVWGEDRFLVSSGRLTATWSRGPFRSARAFERDRIHRLSMSSPHDYLVLEGEPEHVELTRMGSRGERRDAAAALNAELGVSDVADTAGRTLPNLWEEIVTPEGERALVPNQATRRTQARAASIATIVVATVACLVGRRMLDRPNVVIPTLLLLAVTIALAVGAVRLARGRKEWRIRGGGLTLRKRFGANVTDVFEARRLVLDSASDSDGDVWFELFAVGEGGPEAPAKTPVVTWRPARPPNSRSVARLMNRAAEVRDLAAWLSHAAGIELDDRTTPDRRAAELARLRATLEQSGKVGKWAAKLVDKLDDTKRSTG